MTNKKRQSPPDAPESQEPSNSSEPVPLPGFPGYRTQPGKSGLGYLETTAEFSHMEGTLIRRLFTFRLRTRNPIYLAVMLIIGLVLTVPLALSILEKITSGETSALGFSILLAVFGITLLVNFFLSIRSRIARK